MMMTKRTSPRSVERMTEAGKPKRVSETGSAAQIRLAKEIRAMGRR